MDTFCTRRKARRFSIFPIVTRMLELTFGKSNQSFPIFWPRPIFQDFHPGKRTFKSFIQNDSTENFERTFFGYLIEALWFQGLCLLCLATEKSHVDPATRIQSHLKNNAFFWSTGGFSGRKIEFPRTKNFWVFFSKASKKLQFEIFSPAISNCVSHSLYERHPFPTTGTTPPKKVPSSP